MGHSFLNARGGRPRLYYSLLATTLLAALLYYQVSGSLRTVAWGVEGVALLASGFPLRDRVLRLSGITLLLACILKLFVWDLRHLETLPANSFVPRTGPVTGPRFRGSTRGFGSGCRGTCEPTPAPARPPASSRTSPRAR